MAEQSNQPEQPHPADATAKRCPECNGELSACGEMTSDGPRMDCRACRLTAALAERTRERDDTEDVIRDAWKALIPDWDGGEELNDLPLYAASIRGQLEDANRGRAQLQRQLTDTSAKLALIREHYRDLEQRFGQVNSREAELLGKLEDAQQVILNHQSANGQMRRDVDALREQVKTLEQAAAQGDDKVLRCAFCGQAYPQGTPVSHHERLTEHVKVCPKHPMRRLSDEFDSYMRELARSIGVDMEVFEQPSAHGNDRLRWAVIIQQRIVEIQDAAARAEAAEQELEKMREALKLIRDNRDHRAETGKYLPGTMQDGPNFDDWAADVADAALTPAEGEGIAGERNTKR